MDADREIADWKVRTDDERKLPSVTGTRIDAGHVRSLVRTAGFEVFDEIRQPKEELQVPAVEKPPSRETYFPLILVFLYLIGFVAISQFRAGRVYPFIELALGICYLTAFAPLATNLANCAIMLIGTAGVGRSLLNKTEIRCACLGTVFNLPMSKVTLIEDLIMVVMSATMIGAIL